jgi:hypothetical protein
VTGEGALEMNGMRIGKVRNKSLSEFLSLILSFPYVCPEPVLVK